MVCAARRRPTPKASQLCVYAGPRGVRVSKVCRMKTLPVKRLSENRFTVNKKAQNRLRCPREGTNSEEEFMFLVQES